VASSEKAVCLTLLVTSHLSDSEREALPDGRVRFSTIREVIGEALESDHWFPERVDPGNDLAVGAALESRDGKLWLHEQHEADGGGLGPIQSRPVLSVDEGARMYLAARHGWNPTLDGIGIDWAS
jgi:hypothetical protein